MKRLREELDQLFSQCVVTRGDKYLQAEQAILALGSEIASPLREKAKMLLDPFARTLALMLASLADSGSDAPQRSLEYMNAQEKDKGRTIVMVPRYDVVAANLRKQFGSQAVLFLSVRLVKQTDWPQWKAAAVLEYMSQEKELTVLAPLMRFAVESNRDIYQNMVQLACKPFPPEEVTKAWEAEAYFQRNPDEGSSPSPKRPKRG